MDTMELTKIVGSICGALLALLLVAWGAETLYHVGGDGHGDGHGGEAKVAYVIEVEEDAGADSGDADVVPFADLLAAADIGKGEKVFGKCKACHKLEDGANGTGPHLYAVVDRAIGGIDGYSYSGVLAGLGGAWTVDELNAFLESPKKYAKGTKMSFNGLKKPTDRANLIAYLGTIGN